MRSRTSRDSRTPRAAVGSSRITTFDAKAAVADVPDELEYSVAFLDAEGCGRLVEDHDLAAESGGTRDGHRLTLTTRQRLDGLGDVLQRANAELVEGSLGVAAHPRRVHHPQDRSERAGASTLASEEKVAGDVERGSDRERLVDGLDAGGTSLLRSFEQDRLAVELDLALVGDHRAG